MSQLTSPPKRLYMTNHAELRWLERGGPVATMHEEVASAVRWGVEYGGSEMHMTPCGLVLVTNRGSKSVNTVFTRDMALVTLNSYGCPIHQLPQPPMLVLDERKAHSVERAASRRNQREEIERLKIRCADLLAACKAAKEVLDDLPCGAAEVLRMIDAAISKEEQAPENPA